MEPSPHNRRLRNICGALREEVPRAVSVAPHSVGGGGGGENYALLKAVYAASQKTTGPMPRVAIGWNTNLDLIVNAVAAFEGMGMAPSTTPSDNELIDTPKKLSDTFQHFFSQSAAGERPMSDSATFDALVAAAEAVPEHKFFTGGNAALMAARFAQEGCPVLLGGPVGKRLRKFLEAPGMTMVSEGDVKEDIHMILEYMPGQTWGGAEASRGNRFILNQGLEENISKLTGMEEHMAQIKSFNPSVVVASGINIMEGQPPAFRTKRLSQVQAALGGVASDVPIHLELASVADSGFMQEIVDQLFVVSDSIGLNEQELADLYRAMGGTFDAETEAALRGQKVKNVPDIAAVTDTLAKVFEKVPLGKRRVARVHFHCLAYHIVAEVLEHSRKLWKEPSAAVARGSVTATTRAADVAHIDGLTDGEIALLAPRTFSPVGGTTCSLTPSSPLPVWSMGSSVGELRFTMTPVLVCKQPKKTVGLGDNISATALAYAV